jgi:hypothetical protein
MKKVIQVIVFGGNVQDIRSNFKTPNIKIRITDYDNEPDSKVKNLKYSLMYEE